MVATGANTDFNIDTPGSRFMQKGKKSRLTGKDVLVVAAGAMYRGSSLAAACGRSRDLGWHKVYFG